MIGVRSVRERRASRTRIVPTARMCAGGMEVRERVRFSPLPFTKGFSMFNATPGPAYIRTILFTLATIGFFVALNYSACLTR